MTVSRRPRHSLIVAVVVAVCALARADAFQQPRQMQLTPGKPFVLDFSGSPDGGVSAGSFNNFAFNLSLREPARRIAVRRDELRKDTIATYDYAGCTMGQEGLLERPVRELAAGDAAWVDYVDLEMIPLPQKNLKWEGGVCYGYRRAGAGWQWRLTATPLTYDAATDRVRARIWIKEANVDALKLVFDHSVPRQFVRTVTVTIQPVER
jgi:hypothetical protein